MDTLINRLFNARLSMIAREDVTLSIATEKDAETLSHIQHEAFDAESLMFHRTGPGGPAGYDTIEGQIDLMKRTDFLKIEHDGHIVGGLAVAVSPGRCRMVRIFIDPSYQGRGIGQKAVGLMFLRYPSEVVWELDTPSWSLRNHRFYEKMGFRKVGETDVGERGFPLFLYERRFI